MSKSLLREGVLWGALLWLFGYVLSFALYAVAPINLLGWVVMPFALARTVWVAGTRVRGTAVVHYVLVGAIWTILAVVLDYILLVKLLHPADGYYKFDVYYTCCLLVPVIAGWQKAHMAQAPAAIPQL